MVVVLEEEEEEEEEAGRTSILKTIPEILTLISNNMGRDDNDMRRN